MSTILLLKYFINEYAYKLFYFRKNEIMILCYVIMFEMFEINEFGLPFEIVKYSTNFFESHECVKREK